MDLESFKSLLGDGSQFGVSFQFATQNKPNGLAEALIIAEEFLNGDKSMMILGDNFFHGDGLGHELKKVKDVNPATSQVDDEDQLPLCLLNRYAINLYH